MVKPKQKNICCAPGKKQEQDLLDEGDWMVVKKQRITILIPPLPVKVHSMMPNVGEGQLPEKPTNTVSQLAIKTNSLSSKQPVIETAKSMSLSPRQAIQVPKVVHPSEQNLTSQKPSNLHHGIASHSHAVHSYRDGKGFGRCSSSRGSKRMMIFADSSAFINQRMRASYLEKKIRRAGGLENWLVSLGLACFVKIFQMKRINKFQLANLSMKKLKDMGADAVGPRRKLMHAIDCLCEPHCFQHL